MFFDSLTQIERMIFFGAFDLDTMLICKR